MKKIHIFSLLVLFLILRTQVAVASPPPTADIIDDLYDMETKTVLAKIVWGEARGVYSQTEQSAVVWTILNRCDAWNKEILDVALQKNQFAYKSSYKTTDDYGRSLLDLVSDVLSRWDSGEGRTLPEGYLYYHGRNGHNWFRKGYRDKAYWDWSLDSPYET